jgi:peptide deformylase
LKVVAANPEIVSTEGEQDGEEGCLSVGKVHATLKRPARVTLHAQDEKGNWYEQEAEGLAARCFQHETDHCDGILFINRLTPLKRDMVKKKFQKMKKWR